MKQRDIFMPFIESFSYSLEFYFLKPFQTPDAFPSLTVPINPHVLYPKAPCTMLLPHIKLNSSLHLRLTVSSLNYSNNTKCV